MAGKHRLIRVELSSFCPRYHHAVETIGRRWTGAIVRAMLAGATRFSEITTAVPNLSDRLCSVRLRELEAEGMVRRTVVPDTPARTEYHLTAKGADLADTVAALSLWAETWLPDPSC
ncbi:MarR family transcriptional regulator [Frankia sp. CcI156]|jgi:DNA-binding HxlR family transcriptional regulator|uniref:Transcriptional regulator n=1 Tax=Frankia casuarinae (strain DSM 45818 / CECT 9043 / HFP020203 / CcI3) TaxID=106370 RepID=A0A1X1PQS2_FRACC|nr:MULTISPECIES: helix-turn-helix domain-containing protein [Frankia]ONH27611.1 MarR family transcriptional regulator [Frankia sp. CcI156]ABD13234.1 putative transcriptional regulator [Frankia casuarinae]EYT93753.1 transcriptional regulator, HxlR family [Frankia casuarinae]KDA44397.1 transcriptional regulator, HxlR family [Frankia sp. BMG5.23]OAA26300.1 putative transcriptional regulator [Frankia casuarinae]